MPQTPKGALNRVDILSEKTNTKVMLSQSPFRGLGPGKPRQLLRIYISPNIGVL
jgi:hypothetical protein